MSSKFWTSIASYCQELAPVAGPLLSAVGETADAVERAGRKRRSLRAAALDAEVLLTEDDF